MHELSIAASIVEAVTETAAAYPGTRVKAVHLRLGALSDVVEDSLSFCWELTVKDTPLESASLEIEKVPVVVHCARCNEDVQLESVQHFRCPKCGEPTMDLRQGKELEIESIEVDDGTE
ncbi:MAG: hydrogenase maturation nickel metallochaperone HypA [Terracidiphilus sp.]|nr:hydrogenase maturation nickel metallochaperone HypA [Terracidiphilus sp.]